MKTKIIFIFLLLLGVGKPFAQTSSLKERIDGAKKEILNWDSIPGTDEQKMLSVTLNIPIQIEDEHRTQWERDPWLVLYKKTIFTEREVWYSKQKGRFFVLPNRTIATSYATGKDPIIYIGLLLCTWCSMIALTQAGQNEKKHIMYQPVLYAIIAILLPIVTYLNPLLGGLTLIILVILFRRKIKLLILKRRRKKLAKKTY